MGQLISLAAARQRKQTALDDWFRRCTERLVAGGMWPERVEEFMPQLELFRLEGLGARQAAERLLSNLGFLQPDDWF